MKNFAHIKHELEHYFNENDTEDPPKTQFKRATEAKINHIMSWCMHTLVPIFLLALLIELTIIFSSPLAIAMSPWFVLKTPVSIAAAYLLLKLAKIVCSHMNINR